MLRSFTILPSGEGLSSFNKNNRVNFYGKKKWSEGLWSVYLLRIREKTLSEILSSSSNLKLSNV